jgi:hypothetical protein
MPTSASGTHCLAKGEPSNIPQNIVHFKIADYCFMRRIILKIEIKKTEDKLQI